MIFTMSIGQYVKIANMQKRRRDRNKKVILCTVNPEQTSRENGELRMNTHTHILNSATVPPIIIGIGKLYELLPKQAKFIYSPLFIFLL
jgi:hypothetical protein